MVDPAPSDVMICNIEYKEKMKIVMYRDNMFCDIFLTNLTPSRDPSDSTSGYNAYTAEFLNDAFEQEDHTNTRPVKFT
jgi:hypothetical protein